MSLEKVEENITVKYTGLKRIKRYILRFFIFIAGILIIGFLYEKIGEYEDAKKFPPVGEMVEVNNHKINVFSKGEGDATVVFFSGFRGPSSYADFYPLYNEISNYARVVTYDRPGNGWSEITDKPRDVDSIVKEMHEALEKSGQKAPYILVGHSYASLQTIRFAQIYKNEVSGIVLIDGVNPEFYAQNGAEIPKSTEYTYKFLKYTGIARFILYHTNYLSKETNLLPDDFKNLYKSMALKTMYNKNIMGQSKPVKAGAKTILEDGHLGNLPIRILTNPSDSEWVNSQEALKEWSTDSKQVVVEDAGHAIHHYKPDIVINEIKDLIQNYKQ